VWPKNLIPELTQQPGFRGIFPEDSTGNKTAATLVTGHLVMEFPMSVITLFTESI
jgi:hypothetical protein